MSSAAPVPGTADRPEHVQDLLASLRADPGRPRLTWYGPDAERIELSGRVLENWVAKTANLLLEEADAGPGTRVRVDLPTHWRTAVWLLAVWATGAEVVLDDAPAHPVDVLVTTDPAGSALTGSRAPLVVAVALGALATSFGSPLPDGVLDAAAEVRGFADSFQAPARPDGSDPALTDARGHLTHDQLWSGAYAAADERDWDGGCRVLVAADPGLCGPALSTTTGGDVHAPVAALLGPLVAGGSVIWHHAPPEPGSPAEQALDEAEQVTDRFDSPGR